MRNRTPLFAIATAISALAAFGAVSAQAVELPCSTAKLIVPWGAGGDTDIIFRLLVDEANKQGAKPKLQVVNVSGQGGNKGAKDAKASPADGCTLFAMHDSAIISYLAGRVNFTWDAFAPIATVSYTPSVIGANTATPYKDMMEFVATAKKAPGTVTAGVTLGSTSQFVFLLIEDAAKIKLKYVPYEGTRQRLTALLAKNIQVGEMNILTAKQYMKEGSLKGLGIAAEKRDPLAPDLPTLKEQGIDVVYGLTRGIVAPKGTKPEVIKYWEGVIEKAAKSKAVEGALAAKGTSVVLRTPAEYTSYLKKSYAQYEKLAIAIGMYKKK
jgi:tripartite-type tricarboxylate transporter receptor subunit TctC